MKISELMTPEVEVIRPDDTLHTAAQMMADLDTGALPVGENDRLVGMITDRDIAVRAVARGRGPDTPVREAMTDHVDYCYDDDEIEDVAVRMSDMQVRRFPVISREDNKLVGIVSLGDLTRSDESDAAKIALDGVTDPGGQHSQTSEG